MAWKKGAPYWRYLTKSISWVSGNATFGLAPLLFMTAVFNISQKKVGGDEITHLIHGGAIVFVCSSVMGAVLIDYVLGGYLNRGSVSAAIIIPPLAVTGLISINYLLINLQIIDGTSFELSSLTTIFVILLSVGYSIFVKTDLYIKEDTKHVNL